MNSPYFGVSHESITEAYRETVRVEGAVTVFLCDGVHVSRVSGLDRVALHALLGRDTPAIVDAVSDGEDCKRRIWEDCRCALHEADLVLDLNHDERRSVSGDWLDGRRWVWSSFDGVCPLFMRSRSSQLHFTASILSSDVSIG